MAIEPVIKDSREPLAIDRGEAKDQNVISLRTFILPDGSGVLIGKGTPLVVGRTMKYALMAKGLVEEYVPPPPPPVYSPEELAAAARAQAVADAVQTERVKKPAAGAGQTKKLTKGGKRK